LWFRFDLDECRALNKQLPPWKSRAARYVAKERKRGKRERQEEKRRRKEEKLRQQWQSELRWWSWKIALARTTASRATTIRISDRLNSE
jgi:hypothetical protein